MKRSLTLIFLAPLLSLSLEIFHSGNAPPTIPKEKIGELPITWVEIGGKRGFFTPQSYFPMPIPTRDPFHRWLFNRVLYAYIERNRDFKLIFRIYFPSRFLSSSQKDYLPLAKRISTYLLYFYILGREKLGHSSLWAKDEVVNVWLCEEGEAGGEQIKNNLYFYEIGEERSEVEWLRETAHEWGHQTIPPIGPYREPEEWANGIIGERLLLSLLLQECPEQLLSLKSSLQQLLESKNRLPLSLFQEAGFPSSLMKDDSERGFWYLIGFVLSVYEKKGVEILKSAFQRLESTSPLAFYELLTG